MLLSLWMVMEDGALKEKKVRDLMDIKMELITLKILLNCCKNNEYKIFNFICVFN